MVIPISSLADNSTPPTRYDILWDSIGNDPESVRRCLIAGLNPNLSIRGGISPLVAACKVKDFQSMKYLIAYRANINFRYFVEDPSDGLNEITILIEMCGGNYNDPILDEMIQWILENGADPAEKDSKGDTAFHHAARHKGIGIIRILLDKGADPNATNQKNETPLMDFLSWGFATDVSETVQLFLLKRIDFTIVSISGDHLIHYAARAPAPVLVKKLLEHQINPNLRGKDELTPLMCLCKFWENSDEAVEVADLLIQAEADLSLKKDGTVLHYAVGQRCPRLVLRFLEAGADPNARDAHMLTPLHYLGQVFVDFIQYKPDFLIQIAQHLHKYGSFLEAIDEWGAPPLHAARAFPEAVRELLRLGAKPDAVDNKGTTLLGHACYSDRPDHETIRNIESLLIYHADPNLRHRDLGITALDAELKRTDRGGWQTSSRIVRILLENGATKNVEDSPLIAKIQREIRQTRNRPDSPWAAETKSQIRRDHPPQWLARRESNWRWTSKKVARLAALELHDKP